MWPFRRAKGISLRRQLAAANRALQRHNLPEAIAAYRAVLAEYPENLTACLNLGVALHMSGQHTPAIEQFEHALALDPKNATAAMNLGAAHAALGHLDRGIEALIRALEAAPAKRDIHYNLAALYLRKGEAARAMAELELELALNPDHALAKKAAEDLRRRMFGST